MRSSSFAACIAVACSACLTACTAGAPPGFSSGHLWTFPLVDPLAAQRVVAPVYVHGHGPFLFAIDPLSDTLVDAGIFDAAGVVSNGYAPDRHSDLADVRIGDLTISSMPFTGVPPHALDAAGRHIEGVLGRALVTNALVYGIDRDRGIAYVTTPEAFRPRAHARAIAYGRGPHSRGGEPPELLVSATIDGARHTVQLDLGRARSRLRRSVWSASHFAPITGGPEQAGTAGTVEIAGIAQHGLAFGYEPDQDLGRPIDGTLGLDFFAPFSIDLDRSHRLLYVAPRTGERAARAQRLARWGPALSTCRDPGCAVLALRGEDLYVTPEAPGRSVEVIAHALASSGDPLPALGIEIPAGSSPFAVALGPSYRDATLEVVDASPFPLPCPQPHGCVIPLDLPED